MVQGIKERVLGFTVAAPHLAEVGGGGTLLEADAHPEDHVSQLQVSFHRVKDVVRGDHITYIRLVRLKQLAEMTMWLYVRIYVRTTPVPRGFN